MFALMNLPAAMVSGSMIAVAMASLAKLPVSVPPVVRDAFFITLGFTMGANMTPETVDTLLLWPLSVILLLLVVVLVTVVTCLWLMVYERWDYQTARFASVPGAFSYVMAAASEAKADVPRAGVIHALRLVVVSAVLPYLASQMAGQEELGRSLSGQVIWQDLLWAAPLCAVAGWLAKRMRVPAGALVGAAIVSAFLHAVGMTEATLPEWLIQAGFLVTGCFVGVNMKKISLSDLVRALRPGLFAVAMALIIAASLAWIAHVLLGLPYATLWLAYVPGGLEVMIVLALALGLDPTFVGAHHVLRFLFICLALPFWNAWAARNRT